MKTYSWDNEKNAWLIANRAISFERVISMIDSNGLLDIVQNPNTRTYPHQFMFIVEIDKYAWLVPFVESDADIFLKTVIPSRKATKQYLGGN